MKTLGEIEAKRSGLAKRIARECEHDGEFSARARNNASEAMCPCWDAYRVELAAFEACIPQKFWRTLPEHVTDNREVFERVILVYLSNLRLALTDGAGILLHGPNGCGKSMFLSYILMEIIRNTRASVYYTTSLQLDKDTKRGFRDPAFSDRLEQAMRSGFVVIDELGKEQFREGDSYARMNLESWLRWREQNNRPTLLASNKALEALREPVEGGGYGETFGSLVEGSCITVAMEAVDVRTKKGAELQRKMGY